PAPPALSTLSLHDALPISPALVTEIRPSVNDGFPSADPVRITPPGQPSMVKLEWPFSRCNVCGRTYVPGRRQMLTMPCPFCWSRSEEHTSELQSRSDLVCR